MKKLFYKNLKNFIPLFLLSLTVHAEVPTFLKRYPVWRGFLNYNWLSKVLVIAAAFLSLVFLSTLVDWWAQADTSTALGFTNSVGTLAQNITTEGYDLFMDGGMKYVILLLVEVLIFHATYKTLNIITEEERPAPTLNDFVNAEIRMFKIVIRSWILELLTMACVGVFLSILGMDILESFIHILIQCYFLGLAVIDNYHEHRGRTIRESYFITHQVIGLAFGVGLILYLFLFLPFVGAIVGPLVAGVAATLAMDEVERNWHLILMMPTNKKLHN